MAHNTIQHTSMRTMKKSRAAQAFRFHCVKIQLNASGSSHVSMKMSAISSCHCAPKNSILKTVMNPNTATVFLFSIILFLSEQQFVFFQIIVKVLPLIIQLDPHTHQNHNVFFEQKYQYVV